MANQVGELGTASGRNDLESRWHAACLDRPSSMRRGPSLSPLLGLACGLLGFLRVEPAEACSCVGYLHVESPSSGAEHPQGLPFLYQLSFTGASLWDASGNVVGLSGLRTLSVLGGCGAVFQFASPLTALTPGAEYVLAADSASGSAPPAGGKGRFIAAAGAASHIAIDIELTATLEQHARYLTSGAACDEFDGVEIGRTAYVELRVATPLLLLVSATQEDPLVGPLVHTAPTRDSLEGGAARLGLPVTDQASGCVDVAVFDAAAVNLGEHQLCPTLDMPASAMFSAEVTNVRASPLPGNEPTPTAQAPDDGGLEATRCSYGRVAPRAHWNALAFVGLIGLGLGLRRVFR